MIYLLIFAAFYLLVGIGMTLKAISMIQEGIRDGDLPKSRTIFPLVVVSVTMMVCWPLYLGYCLAGWIFKF